MLRSPGGRLIGMMRAEKTCCEGPKPLTGKDKITRTRLSPEARREQLLQCAMAAFAEHGLARGTHSHVARRANVSVAAVHSYFRTRNDLVAAVLDEVEAFLQPIVSSSLASRHGVREALTVLATAFAHEARTRPDLLKVWLDWSTGVRADIWPRYVDVQARLHKIAEQVFARGKREGLMPHSLNVKAAARLYLGDGHTVTLMVFAGVSQRELDIVIHELVARFLLPEAG